MPARLQSCTTSTVRNYTPFGRMLRRMLNDRTGLLREGSWVAGGCWTLAEALRGWSGQQLDLRMVVAQGIPQHVVASFDAPEYGAVHLDGDGMASSAELLMRMRRLEKLPDPAIEVFDANLAEDCGIGCYEHLVPTLIRTLRDEFGHFAWDTLTWDTDLTVAISGPRFRGPRYP